MLTRPNDSDARGRGLMLMTYPPPAAAGGGGGGTQTGVVSSAPVWSSSSSPSSPPSSSSVPTPPSRSSPALPSPPPTSSTLVSFSSPSPVGRPLPSHAADASSIALFPRRHLASNGSAAVSSSPASPPSGASSTPLITSSTHSSTSSPYFSHTLPLSAGHYHPSTCPSLPPPCASHTAATVHPPCSPPATSVSSSSAVPVSLPHTAPVLPPGPPPCCSCSALLPRLLSAHRLEVRRLLRGALATLGRRLDSLERRSRRNVRKKRSRNAVEGGGAPSSRASTSSPLDPRLTGQEEEGEGKRKRRKQQREIKDEEAEGRFVVRMSFTGDEEGATLILRTWNHRRRAESGSPRREQAVALFRPNGFRTPPMLPYGTSASSRQSSSHPPPSARSSQSDTLELSSGRWRFSSSLPPGFLSSHGAGHAKPTLQLHLSAAAAEMIVESMRRGACGSPLRTLRDWTAPPSLSADHCYMRALALSSPSDGERQQNQRDRPGLHLPLPLSSGSTHGPSAGLPNGQSLPGSGVETSTERGKRVSQIRIRRAPPRETPLTPMGLPKVKRLKKKEFSLEEIYTNKNYKSPTSNRTLETIFEEPREKDGALLRIGHQRRRRLLLFPDFTQPRKRKRPSGIGLPVASVPKKRAASRRCHGSNPVEDESDVDVMLVERLSALEDFLTQQGLDV